MHGGEQWSDIKRKGMLVIPFRIVNAVFGKCQDAQHQEVHNGSFRTSVHNIKPKDTVLCKQNANKFHRNSPFVYTNSGGYFGRSCMILRHHFSKK